MLSKAWKYLRRGELKTVLMNRLTRRKVHDLQRQTNLIQEELAGVVPLCGPDRGEEAREALQALLRRHFPLTGGWPESVLESLGRAMQARRLFVPGDEANEAHLLTATASLDPGLLPAERWCLFSRLATANGLLRLATLVREKAIRRSFQEAAAGGASYGEIKRAFSAALDQGDFAAADHYRARLNKMALPPLEAMGLNFSYALSSGNEVVPSMQDRFTPQDRAFARLVRDSSVAIVGPAPSSAGQGSEIDAFDLVVRTNFQGRERITRPEENGSQTAVAYYNTMDARALAKHGDRAFLDQLRFLVFRRRLAPYQDLYFAAGRARLLFDAGLCLFNAKATMLQLIIYDLLHFAPRRIKIFNANYYLSRNPYHANYRPEKEISDFAAPPRSEDLFWRWSQFASQDTISNLNFAANLYWAGRVELDPACKAVISLDRTAFSETLEAIYVHEPIRAGQILQQSG